MRQKRIYLLIILCSVCYLLLEDNLWGWTKDAFNSRFPSFPSHRVLATKPKHTNVAFLKTHKTGSSTVEHLLLRFAERHNLTVALPVEFCAKTFCYPYSFNTAFAQSLTVPPNIIASQIRFNRKELRRLMPSDTIYITILREPSSVFESSFYYFLNQCQSFMRVPDHSLQAFLADPMRYYAPHEMNSIFAHNNLAFDLGLDKDHPADTAYVHALLEELEEIFSLVMITEYFDESLVVLRHLLSWDLDDILYFKLNMQMENSKKTLSPDLVSKIKSWNSLDVYLYFYFNSTLWRKIEALGEEYVAKEVLDLQRAQERLMRSCLKGQMELRPSKDTQNNPSCLKLQRKADLTGVSRLELSSETQKLCLKLGIPEAVMDGCSYM